MPIFRVTVVSRTTKAINYHHRTGSTHIDFRGTELMPAARGEAKVESQMGSTKIETRLDNMTAASAVRARIHDVRALGRSRPKAAPRTWAKWSCEGDHAKLLSTTDLQSFGLIVTAEPYFAVTQPSDVVVAENFIRNDTTGTIQQVDAKFELLQRGQYVYEPERISADQDQSEGSAATGARRRTRSRSRAWRAPRSTPPTRFRRPLIDLQNAQDFLNKSKNRKRSETNAREAAQMAEDARIITFRKIQEEAARQAERAAARGAASRPSAEAGAGAEERARQAEQARWSRSGARRPKRSGRRRSAPGARPNEAAAQRASAGTRGARKRPGRRRWRSSRRRKPETERPAWPRSRPTQRQQAEQGGSRPRAKRPPCANGCGSSST